METQEMTYLSRLPKEKLEEICRNYPWFGAAHKVLFDMGGAAPVSYLISPRLRSRTEIAAKSVDVQDFALHSTDTLIDEFIKSGGHKIVVTEDTPEELDEAELAEEGGIDVDEEFISEELAEIYLKQAFFDQAIEIYEKLSLQDSQKSIYFAELIEKVKAARAAHNEENVNN